MLEEYLNRMAQGTIPQEDVVFRRSVLTEPLTEEALLQSTVPLSEVTFTTSFGIEDFPQSSYVVFANEVPFNGCFSTSCTQEQIMCMLFPEACLGKHIFDPMEPLEAISVSGCVRVGTYSGYGYRLRYEGPYTESSCLIGFRSRTTTPAQLLFMDALCCEGVLRLLDGSRGKRHRVGKVGLWRVQWKPVPEVPVAVGECVPCGQKGGGVGGELRIAGTGAVRQSRH